MEQISALEWPIAYAEASAIPCAGPESVLVERSTGVGTW